MLKLQLIATNYLIVFTVLCLSHSCDDLCLVLFWAWSAITFCTPRDSWCMMVAELGGSTE